MARLGLLVFTAVALSLPVIVPSATPAAGMMYALRPDGALDAIGEPPLRLDATLVSNGAEPHILVDKLGRSILIGDWTGVYMSIDGGASWFPNTPPHVGSVFVDGWVFAQDDAGTIYATTTNGQMINVATSTNGGFSWQLTASTIVVDVAGIADRPWLAARNNGEVAMIWNENGMWERCSYSTNAGLTWTRTLPASSGNGFPIGGRPAWNSAGKLVYVGDGESTLYRYHQTPCVAALSEITLPPVGEELQLGTATDAAGGIYVAAASEDNDEMTLIGYNGWNAASMKRLVVSPPSLQTNMAATVSVRNPNEIAVAWYGSTTQGDPTNANFRGYWNVSVARVQDFWSADPTITYQQVTSQFNHYGSICNNGIACDTGGADRDLLDYWATTYDAAGNLHLSYGADGTTSQARVYYTKLPALT